LPSSLASAPARSPGVTVASARIRPSAFETILCAATTTSPSASFVAPDDAAVAISAARSSPGAISGSPSSAVTVKL
jgi:hypothetical protein